MANKILRVLSYFKKELILTGFLSIVSGLLSLIYIRINSFSHYNKIYEVMSRILGLFVIAGILIFTVEIIYGFIRIITNRYKELDSNNIMKKGFYGLLFFLLSWIIGTLINYYFFPTLLRM